MIKRTRFVVNTDSIPYLDKYEQMFYNIFRKPTEELFMHTIQAKGILNARNGMNLYRGCQHGCIYCDARSKCYQIDHIFEDIAVKGNALELLEQALKSKRKKCMIGTGSMSDPYMPLESQLEMTRRALLLIARYGFGATVQTKSDLVVRDLDVLEQINRRTKAVVQMSLTCFDEELSRFLEPNVVNTQARVAALEKIQRTGVPSVVWMCPILPFLTDTEENIRGIVEACAGTGVKGIIQFGAGLTLREGNREYFYAKLDSRFPGLKERYIQTYGNAYEIPSPRQSQLMKLFHELCERYGIWHDNGRVFSYLSTFEDSRQAYQLSLFD